MGRPLGRNLPALAYVVVLGAICAGYAFGSSWSVQTLLYSAGGVAAAVATIYASGRRLHSLRGPWLAIAASMACWAAGDVVWYVLDRRGGAPYPSPADGFYLLGYVFLGAGLLGLAFAGRERRAVAKDLIDVSIISLCVALFAWPFVFEPTLEEGWTASASVTIAYAGGDILLLGLLAALVFNPAKRTPAMVLIGAAVAAVFFADVVYYVPWSFASAGAVDIVSSQAWLIGYLLVGVAALTGSSAVPRAEAQPDSVLRRLKFIGATLLAFPAAMALDGAVGDGFERGDWLAFAVASTLAVALVLARARTLVRDMSHMHVRLQTVFESVGVGMIVREGEYMTETNTAVQEMLGYSADELAALRYFDVVHPHDVDDARKVSGGLAPGAAVVVNRRFLHRDGSTVLGRVTFTTAPDRSLHIAVIEDVTTKVERERQRQEAQKLEAVGRLAGGIAHDFNNLLTAVIGHAELIRAGDNSAETVESADVIVQASNRAAALTRQLLTFSRQNEFSAEEIDTCELLHTSTDLLRRVLGGAVAVEARIDEGSPSIVADRSQIDQVLLNLAVNARDAMPDGGTLALAVEGLAHDGADPRYASVEPGTYCRITVSDTGVGMSEETLSRIFEPFFSTKEVGKGTGLGLSTTHGIVTRAGGHIHVSSLPGSGTTFEVLLPAASAPTARALTGVGVAA